MSAEKYHSIIAQQKADLKRISLRIYGLGLTKLVVFVLTPFAVYQLWGGNSVVIFAVACVGIAIFLLLSKWQDRFLYKEDICKALIKINNDEIALLGGDFSAFPDGNQYADSSHPFTFDIDVFGAGSLFQMLNRTATQLGSNTLAEWLKNPLTDKGEIEARQKAVDELSKKVEWRQSFAAAATVGNKNNIEDLEMLGQWAKSGDVFNKPILRLLPKIVIGLNIVMAILFVAGMIKADFYISLFFVIAVAATMMSGKIRKIQIGYNKSLSTLSTYSKLLSLIESQEWESTLLRNIQSSVCSNGGKASESIRALDKVLHKLDSNSNIMVLLVLNGLSLSDLRCAVSMERWKHEYAESIPTWLKAIGAVEALASLANFRFNNPDYVFANIAEDDCLIKAERLVHPLMRNAVPNPIDISRKPYFLVVTGANMAGKSTYLRTVATNYVLGCIGAPMCTTDGNNRLHPATLFTSLRTNDSLRSGESYFFAELKRLKMIIDRLNNGERMFVMLDEILRGTNSHDKQQGSYSFVKQLIQMQANGIIATHDLALARLKSVFPESISNLCFEADICNDELTFSYKIREGVAQNMNACFLMKKMGINIVNDLEN